jgi:hypothetical protein
MNRGRTAKPSFLVSLSGILDRAVDSEALQPLPETDLLWKSFGNGYGRAVAVTELSYRRTFSETEAGNIAPIVGCLSISFAGEIAFLLTKQSEICGAVEVDVSNLLKHWKSVIDLDGDSVRIVSKDRTQGLLIDFNPDDNEWHYEIAAWGNRWTSLILECDRS